MAKLLVFEDAPLWVIRRESGHIDSRYRTMADAIAAAQHMMRNSSGAIDEIQVNERCGRSGPTSLIIIKPPE